jgi:ATP/ADP translocase
VCVPLIIMFYIGVPWVSNYASHVSITSHECLLSCTVMLTLTKSHTWVSKHVGSCTRWVAAVILVPKLVTIWLSLVTSRPLTDKYHTSWFPDRLMTDRREPHHTMACLNQMETITESQYLADVKATTFYITGLTDGLATLGFCLPILDYSSLCA